MCLVLTLCATFLYANAYNPNNEEKEQKIVYNYYIIYKLYMQHQNDV